MKTALASILFAGALFAVAVAGEAQHPKKIPTIGYLAAATAEAQTARTEAFRKGLRVLGYVEGENIFIEYRHAEGHPDQLPKLAADLVHLNVAAIVVQNNTVARAAVGATKTIPIIMADGADPVAVGLVTSLAHPGGNVTGLTNLTTDLSLKRLELLKEIIPNLARVAMLVTEQVSLEKKEMQAASPSLQIQLQILHVRVADDLEKRFEDAHNARAEALAVPSEPSGLFIANEKHIIELAAKRRLPAIYGLSRYANAGGLMSYAANELENYRRAATYVDKILKGAKPAGLPVEQPTKFELIINLKAAKQIGLTIPPSVLLRADKVIK